MMKIVALLFLTMIFIERTYSASAHPLDLEASFESVSKVERDLLGIEGGVKVITLERNGFFSALDIPEGFIITQINNRSVDSPEELEKILVNIRGRFDVIGINERGRKVYYPFRR